MSVDELQTKLLEIGAESVSDRMYELQIQTIYGNLRIAIEPECVYTRFDTIPAEAPAGAELNKHSGKWNFYGDINNENFVDHVVNSIQRIAAPRIFVHKAIDGRVFFELDRCPVCMGKWDDNGKCSRCLFDLQRIALAAGSIEERKA